MITLINILDNAVFEGLVYAWVSLSMVVSFRYLRFPDITMDSTFVLGAAVSSLLQIKFHTPLFLALPAGLLAGFLGGCFTGILNAYGGIDKILAGILSAFVLYSINLLLIDAGLSFGDQPTLLLPFERIDTDLLQALPYGFNLHLATICFFLVMVIITKVIIDKALRSEKGAILRGIGSNESFFHQLGIDSKPYKIVGIGLANMLVAMNGILVAMREGGVRTQRGTGMIIFALSAFIIGEKLIMSKNISITTKAVLGAIFYFLIVHICYALHIPPVLPKLVIGLIIIFVLLDRKQLGTYFWRNKS